MVLELIVGGNAAWDITTSSCYNYTHGLNFSKDTKKGAFHPQRFP